MIGANSPDDFVGKPFSVEELAARIEAVLRRAHPAPPADPTARPGHHEVGRLVIDEPRCRVWGYHDPDVGRSLDVHMRRLRMKLEAGPGDAPQLVTLRGFGYQLLRQPKPIPATSA